MILRIIHSIYFRIMFEISQIGQKINREDRIRTCDPLVPNQVLYQAELLPEIMHPAGFEPATA